MKNKKPFGGHQVRVALVREEGASTDGKRVRTPEDVAELVKELREKDREHFATVLLNCKNGLIGVEIVSIGILDASLVSPREVFKGAILSNAAAVILCHNHPSGDPSPSTEDIRITKTLQKAGEMLDIKVIDHVIIGNSSHISLRESGLLSVI